MRLLASVIAACALLLSACGSEPQQLELPALTQATFFAEENPQNLSQWGQLQRHEATLELGENVLPYDLNTELFTDYAHKLRTIWMPEGTSASYTEGEVFDFPVGTVITKTFFYPVSAGAEEGEVINDKSIADLFVGNTLDLERVRLIETRVLVRREAGWEAIPYRWNEDQTDAVLDRLGAVIPLTLMDADGEALPFNYVIPSVNDCAGCHASNSNEDAVWPIGPKARHLNRDFAYSSGTFNQLSFMSDAGLLIGAPDPDDAPRNAAWGDLSAPLESRARAYLDINCSHCHSPIGPADTSGLSLEPDATGPMLGLCKPPIAAGAGTGNRRWGIYPGHPDDSILVYRMESDELDKMMPEMGRSTIHYEGVELVRAWVSAIPGSCS